jgi:hypothetical protein
MHFPLQSSNFGTYFSQKSYVGMSVWVSLNFFSIAKLKKDTTPQRKIKLKIKIKLLNNIPY